MRLRILSVIILSSLLSGCLAPPPAGPAASANIARVVESAQRDIGTRQFGTIVHDARIEGETVIFAFEIPDAVDELGITTQEEFATQVVRNMAREFCRAFRFRDYIRKGGKIRVDFVSETAQPLFSIPFPITAVSQCA